MKNELRKLRLLILVMCSFLLITSCQKENDEKQILEINDTEVTYFSEESGIVRYKNHFMIIQPPQDLTELKAEIDSYLLNYPLDFETIKEEVQSQSNIEKKTIKKVVIELFFYRESDNLPIDWKPVEEYMDTDRIEYHNDDSIAYVYWSDFEQEKSYLLSNKGKDNDDYGKVIESVRYYGDEIVE